MANTPPTANDIWSQQRDISRQLLAWAVGNMSFGALLYAQRSRFWRGIATQAVSWGAINAAIALIGSAVTAQRKATLPNPNAPQVLVKETHNLTRILWINGGLDVLYILGGLIFALSKGKQNSHLRGQGWGVVIQGLFLLLFDVLHARNLSQQQESPKQ